MQLPTTVVPLCTSAQLLDLAAGKLPLDGIGTKRVTFSKVSSRALSLEIPPELRAMEPMLAPGMIGIFDPDKLPTVGDIVCVVLLARQEVLLGRYRPGARAKTHGGVARTYSLVFDNDKFYEPRAITGKDRAVFMGTLVECARLGSR